MNEGNRNVADNQLHNVFRSVRGVEVPTNLRANCLVAALDGLKEAESAKPVQQDTTKLRLPLAIAASLLFGVGLGWGLRGNTRETVGRTAQTQTQQTIVTPSAVVNATSFIERDNRAPQESILTEELYLCGVGRIQSKVTLFANGDSK